MQPYFFPYLGYFQLMNAVDCFVFYDDAQYMKGGWINRNRILGDAGPQWLTFPVKHAPIYLPIKDRVYVDDPIMLHKMIRKIELTYRRAPYFSSVFDVVAGCLKSAEHNIALFNQSLLTVIASGLDITCRFAVSSDHGSTDALRSQGKVLDICRRMNATQYLNPVGGLDLYDVEEFSRSGVELSFLKSSRTSYDQFSQSHMAYLSIIDVLMFNGWSRTKHLLCEFEFVGPNREGHLFRHLQAI